MTSRTTKIMKNKIVIMFLLVLSWPGSLLFYSDVRVPFIWSSVLFEISLSSDSSRIEDALEINKVPKITFIK